MKKGMIIVLFLLSITWIVVGCLVVMGAWNENEMDYKEVTGELSKPLELSYEEHDVHEEQRVVMATIFLKDDSKAYRLRGKLYHLNRIGMESLQVGETLDLMVKTTAIIGGAEISSTSKSVSVSGIYKPNGEVIIPLEKGIAHAKQRLLIGIGLILMGLLVGIWGFLKNRSE